MRSFVLLQVTTGGQRILVLLTLLGLVVTAVLSLGIAYLVARRYSDSRDRGRLYLALGLVLLTTGPILIQFVLANLTDVSALGRSAAANTSKLLGLAATLYAIYGVSRNRASGDSPRSKRVRK
ncbi:hypothetical protein [Natrinema soli]|uniref:Integral membrane protein n=1 Tax=Natrinema soli TaxID=1930624 RepID=A0ABD5SJQ9_9EURY|nr:hypothetical protein [Natrinema soli]